MFSKQESARIKTEFWTAFGKSFPRKWLLYNTKIKDFAFKFSAERKRAEVSLDIAMKEEALRLAYFEKMQALESILEEALGEVSWEAFYTLENGKTISRIWVTLEDVSIYNKATWSSIFEFFVDKMSKFEAIFYEYEDFIKAI
ncbi:DUF4268 domain-containing protein [Riemerella columbina]|uniref:DUF4268 domain-containing protein n=1 Tax=Riemerella columbina TaxID=103810 RepID=UPI00266F3492|nr:DUF4268 domain-containing protein [Riemerella columbina]WKS94459.1 DUF4268 domain-containing protein [Riemerella columbina]